MYSRAVLAPEDKRFLVREVLKGKWTGEPRGDFGHRFCVETKSSTDADIP